ncbi:MAG: flagellar filament capping protein FliD [Planctomycetota bacterium]
MTLPTQTVGGLISGFDTASIIESLMTIQRRPVVKMENKIQEMQGKQEAYRSVSRLLLSFKTQVDILGKAATYRTNTARSTAESILTATAYESASVGSFTFRSARRARTHQAMSAGLADTNSTAVGAGEIRIDRSGASLLHSTKLAALNGMEGVEHASLRITDGAGQSAVIDLATAETVQDVLDAVNNASDVSVEASLDPTGTRFVLTDLSGGAGNLRVEEVNNRSTAADLGLLGSAAGVLTGSAVYTLSGLSSLAWLRDGLGIDDGALGSITIEDTGATAIGPFTVDLSEATALEDVVNAIAADTGGEFTAEIDPADARRLLVHRTGGDAGSNIVIANDPLDAADTTAADLGILTAGSGGATLTGAFLIGGMNTVLASSLSGAGGAGLSLEGDTVTGNNFSITDRNGASVDIDLSGWEPTLGEILYAINTQAEAAGVSVTAALNGAGNGMVLRDSSGGSGSLTVADIGDAATAATLGIAGSAAANAIDGGDLDRKYLGRATLLSDLNAGSGIYQGSITLTDAYGVQAVGDLSGLATVGEVISAINAAGLSLQARINDTGDGILIENSRRNLFTTVQTSGAVAAPGVVFSDVTKDFAALGVEAGDRLVIESGANAGTYDITNVGATDLEVDGAGFGSADPAVSYRILKPGPVGTIRVEEVGGGTTAADLGILGSAADADLDGSFEEVIAIDANDTLTDVATKIGLSDAHVIASIVNDGSGLNPYHLSLLSVDSGRAGVFVLDTNISKLRFSETTRGQDALLLYGASGASAAPMLLSSADNTFDQVVPGLEVNVQSVDPDREVTITVSRDVESIVTAAEEMVQAYNDVSDLVRLLTRWDEENEAPGLLFGDAQMANLLSQLTSLVTASVGGLDGGISQWYDIGISFRYDSDLKKSILELDSGALRQALSAHFDSVQELMTQSTNVAAGSRYGSIAADNAAGGGTDEENLINGNTASGDFGAANGYEASLALDDPLNTDGKDIITLYLDKARPISQLLLHHLDSADQPAEDWAIRDYTVEYWDTLTGSWQTARTFRGNETSLNIISMPSGTLTDQVRITVTATNAADKKTRLVEIEAFENQGVASRMRGSLTSLTDRVNGLFATTEESYAAKIKDIQASIDSTNEMLEQRELSLQREFAAMESALAQLQAQSDFFYAQMQAWSNQSSQNG